VANASRNGTNASSTKPCAASATESRGHVVGSLRIAASTARCRSALGSRPATLR
jgi:hypothetical protein